MNRKIDNPLNAFADDVGSEGPVVVVGNKTRDHFGGRASADAREVHAPVGVVDYSPEEMTVRVRAGTSVADLHAELAAAGQRSALPERGGTVGGAVVVGQNSEFVLGRGSLRNSVLQVRYVSAEGKVITGGGPTVKNVSGFDIPRLMTGSLGTLGMLGDLILRTNPLPSSSRWLRSDGADPFAVFDMLLRPGAIFFDGTTTTVLLEGHEIDVDAEHRLLDGIADFALTDGPPDLPTHRWSLAPANLRDLDAAATGGHVGLIGVGTVFAERPQPARPVDDASAEVCRRMKTLFDPTGRLNPGRSVLAPNNPLRTGTTLSKANR